MGNLYQIVPDDKKSVIYSAEMYRKNSDGTISWFTVTTTYRFGVGYTSEEDYGAPYKDEMSVRCNLETGFGCEFYDVVGCYFDFSEDLSEEEKVEIEDGYYSGYQGWIYEGDHDWELETDGVEILGPYKVNLIDEESGEVVEEDIALEDAPKYDPNATLESIFKAK
jgi:hypothetical protein